MRTVNQSKRQRDQALDGWRNELRRLFELEKSQREQALRAAAELQKQRTVVTEARVRYDRANEEYLNRAHDSRTLSQSKSHSLLNGMRHHRRP